MGCLLFSAHARRPWVMNLPDEAMHLGAMLLFWSCCNDVVSCVVGRQNSVLIYFSRSIVDADDPEFADNFCEHLFRSYNKGTTSDPIRYTPPGRFIMLSPNCDLKMFPLHAGCLSFISGGDSDRLAIELERATLYRLVAQVYACIIQVRRFFRSTLTVWSTSQSSILTLLHTVERNYVSHSIMLESGRLFVACNTA